MKVAYKITSQSVRRPYFIVVSNYEVFNEVYLWGSWFYPKEKSLTDVGVWIVKYKIG